MTVTSPSAFKVNRRDLILAIETAVSLVGVDDTNHGKRVGYIASCIAKQLGLSDTDVEYAFELGMLHDIGVSTNATHKKLVSEFDWDHAQEHCKIGYELLKSFPPLAQFAVPILYHHTPYPQLAQADISGRDAMMANLVFLADRVDVLGASHYGSDILLARMDITAELCHQASHYFDFELVQAYIKLAESEAFWIMLQDNHIHHFTWEMAQRCANQQSLSLDELKQLSQIMAYIVDQKSPFTAEHSLRVGALSLYIAQQYGMGEEQCKKVEIAALLHDIGKLKIPDEILDKPGKLTPEEQAVMFQHSYETFEILHHINGLEEIAQWASSHHEGINGHGYPFHKSGPNLSMEARIIAVSDVFQALAQTRPYREGMNIDKIMVILEDMVESGKLDRTIVEFVNHHQQSCYDIAVGNIAA
ncbi:HD-GYP domain-containing protein [Vibrio tritonius]|uniref:HD-GYP domain-containing protein n=1 Tax=Vibrio tritonius TaxID=1435069 RepID=UPI00315D52F7